MSEQENVRIDRMINRIDDALIRLTTMEERLAQNARTLERVFKGLEACQIRIQELETKQAISQTKIGFNERIGWIVITTAVGILSYYINHI